MTIQVRERLFNVLPQVVFVSTGIYVFANPLPLGVVQEAAYYVAVIGFIILLLTRKIDLPIKIPLFIGLGLFLLWAVIGLCFTLDFSNTLHDIRGYLIEYLLIFYLLIVFYQSKEKLGWLAGIIIVSSFLFAVGGLILFYVIEGHAISDRFGLSFRKMYTGFMCFITVFASLLSLQMFHCTPIRALRLFWFLSFTVLSVATFLNQGRAAIIAYILGLATMCLEKKKNLVFLMIALLAFSFLLPAITVRVKNLYGAEYGVLNDIREKMFRLSWEVIKDHPVTGVGYGGEIYGNAQLVDLKKYNARLPEPYQQKQFIVTATHNTFLDVAVRTGLVGLALFLLSLGIAFYMLGYVFKHKRDEFFRPWVVCLTACLVSYLAQAMTTDSLYGAQGIILYLIYAMITILWRLAKNDTVPSTVGLK